jgi:pyruvate/2-oxoglutarate dehydrogenase complex dihydrolipoamide acyltransferase (E2) component
MKRKQLSTSRRFRIASHSPADQYGYVESSVNAEPLLEAQQTLQTNRDTDVTIEHLFVKALAEPIEEARYLNGRFVLGRYYEFETVDIATVVTREEGQDMSIIKHTNVPETAIETLAQKARTEAHKSKAGSGGEKTRSQLIHSLPISLLRTITGTLTWLNEYWGVSIPPVMDEPYMTGAAVVSNVGIFDTKDTRAFAHLPSAFGTGLFVALHGIEEQAVAENGTAKTQKRLPFTCTVDHRLLDGHEGFQLLSSLRERLENPESWLQNG